MTKYAWKDSFRTGIDHIDSQHRQFFYLLNELDMAIEQRRADDVLDLILAEPCDEAGLGHAIMDRLRRASHGSFARLRESPSE